jgi:ketosteroid isomerase-like protein
MSDELELIRRYYDAWNAADIGTIAALVHEHLAGHAGATSFRRNELLDFRRALAADFTSVAIETQEVIAQDDRVAALWTSHAETAAGDVVEWRGVSMYRIAGDTIVEIWDVRTA